MKIVDFINLFIAGGLLGMAGQIIRMFVGLAKNSARNEPVDSHRLIGSICIGFAAGGAGIFTITKWKEGVILTEEHFYLLLSIGYAGADFLEGLFRTLASKFKTDYQLVGNGGIMDYIQKITAQAIDNHGLLTDIHSKIQKSDTGQVLESKEDVELMFGRNANPGSISEHALSVIRSVLKGSGNYSAEITSSARTPYDQARIMFQNVLTYGLDSQRKLYGTFGDMVLDVYEKEKNKGSTPEEIIKAMELKIFELGPKNVSKHCADFNKLVVVDLAPSSIAKKSEFKNAVIEHMDSGLISGFLHPPQDASYHLEIPNIQEGIV